MGRQIPGLKTITLTIDGIGVPITKAECDAINCCIERHCSSDMGVTQVSDDHCEIHGLCVTELTEGMNRYTVKVDMPPNSRAFLLNEHGQVLAFQDSGPQGYACVLDWIGPPTRCTVKVETLAL